jgi:DNA-binding beta-propeller fold protein YncE
MFPRILPLFALVLAGCAPRPATPPAADRGPSGILPARWHDSGFPEGDDNYHALTQASDGKIYYVISCHQIETGAQMFQYDPATGKSIRVGDLTEASGEKGSKAIPQGKSHVPFYEANGKLYFATHLGYYSHQGSKELVGVPPPGYKPYPGGHFLSYDLATRKFEKLGSAPAGEGIITMTMDTKRGIIYALTWPRGIFLKFDLETRKVIDFGPQAGLGEKGTGPTFRVVCRAIGVEPGSGDAYFTTSDGNILWFSPRSNILKKLDTSVKRDVLGKWDPDKPGHFGYNWRQILWYPEGKAFYGTHGTTGFLMRFDPRSQELDVIDRITADKSRVSGLYDEFYYGYLGLTLGPDGHTLYFLTGTPAGEEIRLVTYDLRDGTRIDHGPVVLEDGKRPAWAQTVLVASDKRVYTITKIRENGKQKTELLSFPDPLRAAAEPEKQQHYKQVRSWMNPAGMPNPLKEAHGLCFDNDGNVIVVDSVGSRVERFTPEGKWLGEIGLGPGSGPGAFAAPRDARVRKNGEIFVSDANNYRIQVFDPQGKFLRAFGDKGRGPGQLLRAHGLEFSPDHSRLYVVDVDNNRVSVFDPAGKFLFAFGKKGQRPGEFRDAHGLGVAANGDVIVSNYYGPVQRFDSEGKFLFEFAPAGFRGWTHFHSMTADPAGNTYLAARDAKQRNAIVKYDSRGAYAAHWVAASGEGEQGVKTAAVDPKGLVYVAVEGKTAHGVQVFQAE